MRSVCYTIPYHIVPYQCTLWSAFFGLVDARDVVDVRKLVRAALLIGNERNGTE